MEWQILIAIMIAIPVIIFPITAIYYLDIGRIFRGAKSKHTIREK
jgi:hypothetical protein